MILDMTDSLVFAKMQELKDMEEHIDDYDNRYDECLNDINKEFAIYFKAIIERSIYKANLYNLDAHTVFHEMVIPELQAKFEEML